jgi:hypothetical protein
MGRRKRWRRSMTEADPATLCRQRTNDLTIDVDSMKRPWGWFDES